MIDSLGSKDLTQKPIGSVIFEGDSPASIKYEVVVIVKIKKSMKLPSNCDLPFNFSGVKTILLVNAAIQPINAMK